jgi:hypothetical protein
MTESSEERLERTRKSQAFMEAMEEFLRPEVRNIVAAARGGLDNSEYSVEIPDPTLVDLSIEDLAHTVAVTSNAYAKAARMAGLVRAQQKLSEAKYKRVYRTSKVGRNEDEREANAMSEASLEHNDLAVVEAVAEITDALERAARVASESARKIYDRVVAQATADRRSAGVSP